MCNVDMDVCLYCDAALDSPLSPTWGRPSRWDAPKFGRNFSSTLIDKKDQPRGLGFFTASICACLLHSKHSPFHHAPISQSSSLSSKAQDFIRHHCMGYQFFMPLFPRRPLLLRDGKCLEHGCRALRITSAGSPRRMPPWGFKDGDRHHGQLRLVPVARALLNPYYSAWTGLMFRLHVRWNAAFKVVSSTGSIPRCQHWGHTQQA